MPRWHILRTLVVKELLRHLANRGGLALLLLLVVASLLLTLFGGGTSAGGLTGGARRCCVDFWEDGPLVRHLRRHVPDELKEQVVFRPAAAAQTDGNGILVYPQGTGAIQLRPLPGDRAGFKAWFWHPGEDGAALAPFEAWFWQETLAFFRQAQQAVPISRDDGVPDAPLLPAIESERSSLKGGLDPRAGLATSLVLFGVCFVCVYLLPALTCEERERGVLLAQALSPASAWEILAAKFFFYPVLALSLAATLAGTFRPATLARPFFWLALLVAVFGSMSVGLTIASLARTQRGASMGAMGYMLAVALLLLVCQRNDIPALTSLALEYYSPRMLHAVLTDSVGREHWGHLAGAAALACGWAAAATALFRRRGWQ
jgi:hypothetical protein